MLTLANAIRTKNEPIDRDIERIFAKDLSPEAHSANRRWLAAEADQQRKLIQLRFLGMASGWISSIHIGMQDRFALPASGCLP